MNLFWNKVQRKIFKTYYSQKLPIVPRRQLDKDQLVQEIKSERFPTNFRQSKPSFILSFDDTSLLDGRQGTIDCGGDQKGEVNTLFTSLLEDFASLKASLYFVPRPAYYYYSDFSRTHEMKQYWVRHNSQHSLIEKLQQLEKEQRVEICAHGLHHVRKTPRDYFSAFEYDFTPLDAIRENLEKSYADCSSLFNIKGFKPPAWSVGQLDDSYRLIQALKECKSFEFYNLSTPNNGLNYKQKQVSLIYPEVFQGLLNIPQNISILWDLAEIKRLIDLIQDKNGIINLQLHYSPSHSELRDGICSENMHKLREIIYYIEQKDIEFKFNYEVARLYQ